MSTKQKLLHMLKILLHLVFYAYLWENYSLKVNAGQLIVCVKGIVGVSLSVYIHVCVCMREKWEKGGRRGRAEDKEGKGKGGKEK